MKLGWTDLVILENILGLCFVVEFGMSRGNIWDFVRGREVGEGRWGGLGEGNRLSNV